MRWMALSALDTGNRSTAAATRPRCEYRGKVVCTARDSASTSIPRPLAEPGRGPAMSSLGWMRRLAAGCARHGGKPSEINALCKRRAILLAGWLVADCRSHRRNAQHAAQAYASFNSRFWCREKGSLCEYPINGTNNPSLRANQLFATFLGSKYSARQLLADGGNRTSSRAAAHAHGDSARTGRARAVNRSTTSNLRAPRCRLCIGDRLGRGWLASRGFALWRTSIPRPAASCPRFFCPAWPFPHERSLRRHDQQFSDDAKAHILPRPAGAARVERRGRGCCVLAEPPARARCGAARPLLG